MRRSGLAATVNSLVVMAYSTMAAVLAAGGITGGEMQTLAFAAGGSLAIILVVGSWTEQP